MTARLPPLSVYLAGRFGPGTRTAVEALALQLHRSPATQELAARLGVSSDDVPQRRRCAGAYRPSSFEAPVAGTEDLRPIDLLSDAESGFEAVDTAVHGAACRAGLARPGEGAGSSRVVETLSGGRYAGPHFIESFLGVGG